MIPPLAPSQQRALHDAVGGERVLWAACPRARGRAMAFGIWLFAIPWTVFSLFWEAMALTPWLASARPQNGMMLGFGIVFPLFGLPFVAVGMWMMWQPIRAIRRARRTVYALTERRLIELVLGAATDVKSVPIDRSGPIDRREGRDGWGNLSIQTGSHIDGDGDRITDRFEMIGIPDVAGLERKILQLRAPPAR